MERQLILLSTIHTDPQGMRRLYRAIRKSEARDISFELQEGIYPGFNPLGQDVLINQVRDCCYLSQQQTKELSHLLREYTFEWKIALGLSLTKKYNIHYIDPKIEDDGGLIWLGSTTEYPLLVEQHQELTSLLYEQMENLISVEKEREIIAGYAAYTFFTPEEREKITDYNYDCSLTEIKAQPTPATLQRDRIMERRLREIWNNTEGNILHVGGLYHTHGEYHNLYERLKDLNPIRRKLNEFKSP